MFYCLFLDCNTEATVIDKPLSLMLGAITLEDIWLYDVIKFCRTPQSS